MMVAVIIKFVFLSWFTMLIISVLFVVIRIEVSSLIVCFFHFMGTKQTLRVLTKVTSICFFILYQVSIRSYVSFLISLGALAWNLSGVDVWVNRDFLQHAMSANVLETWTIPSILTDTSIKNDTAVMMIMISISDFTDTWQVMLLLLFSCFYFYETCCLC